MLGITELTYTALIAFLIVIIIGPIFIPMLRKFKFGQTVRDDGPQTHLAKNGTPTMGGIIMIVAILITGLTRVKVSHDLAVGPLCIAGFGFIGFLDDFIKNNPSSCIIFLCCFLSVYIIIKCFTTYDTIYRFCNKCWNIIYTNNDVYNRSNSKCCEFN